MSRKIQLNIKQEILQQIKEDLELCKTMTDIDSSELMLALTNRLIEHQSVIMEAIADSQYMTDTLKGKLKTLQEFMRTSKQREKELSLLEYERRKTRE